MTASPKRADSITAPLRHAIFRRIWMASLLSNLGLMIQSVGAAWAMTQMTSTANKVALVQTALMLPIMGRCPRRRRSLTPHWYNVSLPKLGPGL